MSFSSRLFAGFAFFLVGCVLPKGTIEPAAPQGAVPSEIRVSTGKVETIFRRISPAAYAIDYPDYYLMETEVTNALFREYLFATNNHKDDQDVLAVMQRKRQSNEAGSIIISTGDVPMRVEDPATIWKNDQFPAGMAEHPVGCVTLKEATAFCEWMSKAHSEMGLFRLPTWNEWMIAAYGSDRAYPWGNQWDNQKLHSSYGYDRYAQFRGKGEPGPPAAPKRTEPVRARPDGRTPEGLYGMLGNVSEYLVDGDPTKKDYFNLGSRWMGGGFDDSDRSDDPNAPIKPREDYWGYSHHRTAREDSMGFRVLLDPSKDRSLLSRPELIQQKQNFWKVTPPSTTPTTKPAK